MTRRPADVRVRVFDALDGVAAEAASTLVRVGEDARREGRRAAVALSGGSTPRRLFELLRGEFRDRVPWAFLEIFFGDERDVPPDHSDSNYGMARKTFLEAVPIPSEQIHPMVSGREDLEAAGRRYEQTLRQTVPGRRSDFPVLDLIWLGLGEDGHTASLFPGTAALKEERLWVVANEVPHLKTRRLTLTFPALNAARWIQFLVAGRKKASIVREALSWEGQGVHPLPAGRVWPSEGTLEWLLDREAASEIPPRQSTKRVRK